jgi:hypothetical protein
MNPKKSIKVIAIVLLLFINASNTFSCSMYKVSFNGKTMVGSNYDNWMTTPKIWFEKSGYGACFTGARNDGENGYMPHSGMNEYGLAYTRLATATPENGMVEPNKKTITNPTLFLKDILHKCKTVEEVRDYFSQYDHSSFATDVMIYVDQSGKYLIVEPYKLILGNDAKYVLANFCPSTIKDFSTIKQKRYVDGQAFLKNKLDANIDFCTALSDTMHVCRKKLGDGTLLTSIWDVINGEVFLYFYHDYKHQVKFNLKEELAKGDHLLDIPSLFPANKEFIKLKNFQTPRNNKAMDLFILTCFWLFMFFGIFFLITYFRKRATAKYSFLMLLLFPLNLVLMRYMHLVGTEESLYYFPSPYKDSSSILISILAYTPFLLLLLLIPSLMINVKLFKTNAWKFIPKWIFTINNMVCLILIGFFTYWGFYNVFN